MVPILKPQVWNFFDNPLVSLTSDLYPAVYASSFLFANVSGLLDNSLPSNQDNDYVLLGPVLSSFVHTNGRLLERRSLKSPVKITFPFSTGDAPICVFWNFTL